FGIQCYGFLYDQNSHYCIPTGGISAFTPRPNETEGDFYFLGGCKAYVDFKPYNYIRYADITFQQDYFTARRTCECLDARLMAADTVDKWVWFLGFTGNSYTYWLGLDDLKEENNFVWADGQTIKPEIKEQIFTKGKPDGDGDCVFRVTFTSFMDDADCNRNLTSICEQLQFATSVCN
uniref:C-type lectin domain-containing protein n=1 Tax=Biomphalaria glabrata TaxID=6526 RepID=A0A2C9LZ21_BIOGL